MADGSYHHGNLREALISAGRRLLERDGAEGVSLRAAAREVGVSRSAPYAHFAEKRELLSLIAAQGFAELTQALESVPTVEDDTLHEMGMAYLEFAMKNRGLYRLMFGSDSLLDPRHPELVSRSGETFDLLGRHAGETDARSNDGASAVAAWSLVHGLSMLLIEGRLNSRWHDQAAAVLRAGRSVK